jgi:F0F1-type ATP synthase alpha subunit
MPWRGQLVPLSAPWSGMEVRSLAGLPLIETEAYDTSACSPTNVILEHGQGLLALTVTDLGE